VEISKMCRDRVGVLMTMGTGILIASQALTNFSVVSGWCPTTGLTAPFLSYGGSSMIAMLLCVGLLFNTCRRNLDRMWQELLSMRVVPTYKAFAMKTHSTQ
jgi:cell division protein FtsW